MSGRSQAERHGPLGYALATAARAHRMVLQSMLDQLGLHLGQELIVVDLSEYPGSTQAALVERLGVEQPTVAKSIARMERAGIITRVPDPDDRRQIRLDLTPEGRVLVPRVIDAWAGADEVAAAALSSADRRALPRALNKLTAGLTARTETS